MKKFNSNRGSLTKRNFEVMNHVLNDSLKLVSNLSLTRKNAELELEMYYKLQFNKTPALGKKLLKKHITEIYKPYDYVKNYIWKCIFMIEER